MKKSRIDSTVKLEAHWYTEEFGHKPYEGSVVLPVSEIMDLIQKMRTDDIIYAYHTELRLNRIAVTYIGEGLYEAAIHGHGGAFIKNVAFGEVKFILSNFEETLRNSHMLGFKPDWED